jgi:hypothetical protein
MATSPEPAPAQGNPQSLTGVKGILLIFCFVMIFLIPLQSYLTVQLADSTQKETSVIISIIAVFGLIAGLGVLSGTKQALIAVGAYCAVNALACLYWLFIFIRYAVNGADLNPDFLGGILSRLAHCAFWFLYFRYSERVRNTFGANLLRKTKA